MTPHSVAFVSGPYKRNHKSTTDNINLARDCAIYLWNTGYYVICPHLNTANFETYTGVPPRAFLDFCLHLIRSGVVDLLVMLPRWHVSYGAKKEFALARRLDIPIYTWEPPDSLTRLDTF